MFFPTDQDLRDCWYEKTLLANKLRSMEDDGKIELSKQTAAPLIDAPPFAELKRATVTAVKRGTIAGDLLACVYLMDRFDMPEPSIKKAEHVAGRFAKEFKYGDSSPIAGSRRSIREAFGNYRTVSHLWAAYRLNRAYEFSEESELFHEKLPLFLEVSEGLRKFGTTFVPLRAYLGNPLLPPEETWLLPENIQARHLKSNVFPDRIQKYLEDYDTEVYKFDY